MARNPDTVFGSSSTGAQRSSDNLKFMEDQLRFNPETIYQIPHGDLGKSMLCVKFVPQSHDLGNRDQSHFVKTLP